MLRMLNFSRTVKHFPALVVGLAAVVAPTLGYGQAAPQIMQPVDESARVTLKGSVHPLAQPQFDRGPVEDSVAGKMLLVLKRSPEQDAALRQLVRDQQDPASPSYHKWLTPEQFGEKFGVADADVETVTGYLSANGFTVGHVYKNKGMIQLSGTAGQLRNTFHTQIHSYQINGHEFFANANDPQIPAALAPVVRGFAALNNIHNVAPDEEQHATQSMSVTFDRDTRKIKPDYTGNVGAGTFYLLAPSDIQTIYDIKTSSGSAGAGGSGVTVGVVGDSQVNLGLIANYQSLSGFTGSTPVEIVDGDDPSIVPTSTGQDAIIAYEQLELISAAAPNAGLNFYTAAGTDYDTGLNFSIIHAVEDNAVQVLAIGFQACEGTLSATENALIEAAWLQAAAQGITVVAAAGDSGSAGCDAPGAATSASQGLAVNGYASTPYDTAVGGTDFYYGNPATPSNYWSSTNSSTYGSASGYIPEQVWNDNIQTNDYVQSPTLPVALYAGGGGFSTLGNVASDGVTKSAYPVPSWQVNAQKASGVANPTARSLPDVAMFAGNDYNAAQYAICAAPGDCTATVTTATITGGTAGAAAVFAGIMAEVVAKYGVQGNANPALYGLSSSIYNASTKAGIYHDVTLSNNSVACTGSASGCSGGYLMSGGSDAYLAGTGYDEATGLGSVDANNLVTGWKVPATTSSTTTLAISSNTARPQDTPPCSTTPCALKSGASVVHGTFLNFTATVSPYGSPAGNVAFMTNSTLPTYDGIYGEPLVSGVATAPSNYFLPGGTYTVSARYGGDSTVLPSVGTFPITVTPEPSRTFIYSSTYASGSSVVYGTTVNVTAEPFSLTNNNVSTPTGTLGIYNNSNDPMTILPLSSEGTATFNSFLLGGSATYSLVFKYSGDPSYQPSGTQSTPYSIQVTQAPTSVTCSTSNTASANTPVTLSCFVSGAASLITGVPPTGTITLNTAGSNTVVTLSSGFNTAGQAIGTASTQITTAQIPSGGSITATYSADNNYASSNSSVTISTNATSYKNGTSSMTMSLGSTSVATNGSLTVTDTVTESDSSTPNGTVKIYANGVYTGYSFKITSTSATSYTIVPPAGGYLPFPSGTVAITTLFTPTSVNYGPASAEVNENVTDDRTVGDFYLSTVTDTQTITSSSNEVFFKVQVTSIQNFAGLGDPVGLTCTVPAGSNLVCALGNSSVTLGSGGTAITTLEVSGQPTGGSGANHIPAQPQHWWLVGGGSALACLFIVGIPARRRGLQGMIALLVCAVIVTGSIAGCGSNSLSTNAVETGSGQAKNSGGNVNANYSGGLASNMVAPGTYTVIVTATGTSNTTMVHNTSVKVVVNTSTVLANGTYSLINFSNLLLATDANQNSTSGNGLTFGGADGNTGPTDQLWTFTYQNNGYYTIVNAGNGLFMTDPGGSDTTSPTVQVTEASATGDGTQLWTLNPIDGGFEIVNAQSGGVLDDSGFGGSGTPIICYPQKNVLDGINQTWYIQ